MITVEEMNKRIAKAVKSSGKTVEQIAAEAEVSVNAVNRGYYNRVVPRADTLEALCRTLNISADWVLGLTDGPEMSVICGDALKKFRFQSQLHVLFEEMAELQNAICKELRGRDSKEHIAEEIADVEIMLEQMKIHYQVRETARRKRRKKLERLRERIKCDGSGT